MVNSPTRSSRFPARLPALRRWPTEGGWAALEQALTWLTFLILAALLYARFVVVPYAGLYFTPGGLISRVYVPGPVAVGDQLIQVGSVRWADFVRNPLQTVFQNVRPGEVVPIVLERDGATLTVDYVFPGPTPEEFWPRFYSEWPLAFGFWLAGALTVLGVRPRDGLRRLLILFNFLTAIWLIIGSTVGRWQVWGGALILPSVVWLALPVYLHLHWNFPQPLARLPRWVGVALYAAGLALAGLELLGRLPGNTYFAAFALVLSLCLLLLLAHAALQPRQRGDLVWLVVLWSVALAPAILLALAGVVGTVPAFGGGALVGLPLIPAAYLVTAFRRRFGPHEVRANRLLALYLFVTAWVMLAAFAVPQLEARLPGSQGLVTLLLAGASVIAGVAAFPRFQRWVERRLLGAHWPLAQVVDRYAERITTSRDTPSLVRVLTDDLLPSLLIRQSALLRTEAGRTTVVYHQGVEPDALPGNQEAAALAAHSGLIRPENGPAGWPCGWVRVSLPLRVRDELVGVWLLGRRDPDDFYAVSELTTLQTLAHNTGIALTNSVYAERLQALYQNAIDQREAERASLSRELHDHVLQRLYDLQRSTAEGFEPARFDQHLETVAQSLTQTIRGLRPAMLEYGLYRALAALVDDWANRPDVLERQPPLEVTLSVPESEPRYPPGIEQHLYRIVQQAGDNALKHASARSITVSGRLAADEADLTVADDGQGFDPAMLLDPGALEAQGHFGLAGMRERAALIGASLTFDSTPGQGTRVRLRWQRPE